MLILISKGWEDYQLLDTGNGKRLEKFGKYILVRPDPQIIWKPKLPQSEWNSADAIFLNQWILKTKIPDKWQVKYQDLSFWAKLTPFKHTGIFPEQAIQWDWMVKKIDDRRLKIGVENGGSKIENKQVSILNLFAYTGAASLACLLAGAKVTHLDASKPAITWAKENQQVSNLSDKPLRIIIDDALKFTAREIRRGVFYDGIIMDPPIYGHGPAGEVWDFNQSFPRLLENCSKILSKNPLFLIVNAYAISSSALMLQNVLEDYLGNLGGKIEVGELALEEKSGRRLLSTGIFGRWSQSK